MGRKIYICMNCGEGREIVAHGLCRACDMRQRRDSEGGIFDVWDLPDKQAKEHRKGLREGRKALNTVVDCLETLGKCGLIPPERIDALREEFAAYIKHAGDGLIRKRLDFDLDLTPSS